MKRLLCIVGGMNVGGAETFLMKVYRNLDKTQYQMDFAVGIEGSGAYDEEIKQLGGKIFHITPKSKGILKNFSDIKHLVKNEGYEYVLRTSQHSLSALELLAAKRGGAKTRIYRSSNSSTNTGKRDLMMHHLCAFMPKRFANVRLAPSTEAAEYMFGKGCVERKKAFLLQNGIDLSFYQYNSEARKKIRDEFGVEDKFVIGHIGRFNQQKNHKFLVEIFHTIQKQRDDVVLMLVGKGELEDEIKKMISDYGISDKVIFTGVRSDIPEVLSAMDVFVMPSFYEGMPNTVIEAQATGLPCVIADTITKEANITGLVTYLGLDETPDVWNEKIQNLFGYTRESMEQCFLEHRYDIKSVTQDFVSFVFQ